MKKLYLLPLLIFLSLQLHAQLPSALSEKVFKEKIIGQSWVATDSVTLTFQAFHITKDSVFMASLNFIEGAYSLDFAYQFIQVKDNYFELAVFHDGKKAGYLYGYRIGKEKLAVLFEEDRLKISKVLQTFGKWETFERPKE